VLIVGVNGVGKDDEHRQTRQQLSCAGQKSHARGGDTFRAAAAEQLGEWAKRAVMPLVRHNEAQTPRGGI
jgi:fused signal recognition particle receptor